jgi:hypothetical protein
MLILQKVVCSTVRQVPNSEDAQDAYSTETADFVGWVSSVSPSSAWVTLR